MDSDAYDDRAAAYTEPLASGGKLQKLLSGEISVQRAVMVTLDRTGSKLRSLAKQLGKRMGLYRPPLLADLLKMHKQGTRLHVIAAENDPVLIIIANMTGGSLTKLEAQGVLNVLRLANADHTFTSYTHRQLATHNITEILSQAIEGSD